MGRLNTITSHARRDAIDLSIREGRTLTEISARYGVSVQALSRYAISRKAQLVAELEDDGISVSSLVQRLSELADDARQARRYAQWSTPATKARAIESEARVLGQILDRIGVDDLTVSEHLEGGQKFIRLVAKWATENPERAVELVARLRADDDLADLGEAIDAQMKKEKKS